MASSGGSISSWVGGRSAVVVAVVALAIGAATVPVITGDSGGGGGTTANLFVDGSGTCTWDASPGAYDTATACATFDAAEAACATAGTGGTIMAKFGSYSGETVTGTAADSPDNTDCVFQPATGESVTLTGGWIWDTVDDVALEGFNFSDGCNNALAIDNTERFTLRQSQFNGPGSTGQGAIVLRDGGIGSGDGVAEADDTLIEDVWIDCEGTGSASAGVGINMKGGEIGDLTVRGVLIERPHEDHIHLDTRMSAEASGPIIIEDSVLRDAEPCCASHSDAIQFLKAPNVILRRNVFDQIQHGLITSNVTEAGPKIDVENNYVVNNGNGLSINHGSPCVASDYFRNNTFRGPTGGAGYDWACYDDSGAYGNVFMDDAPFSSDAGDYNVFRDGSLTLGGNSVLGQSEAGVFVSSGTTSVANVYPPRVTAYHPEVRTILDPRLLCNGSSPAEGRSHPTDVPATDLLGVTRVDDDGGAYEC